MASVNKVLLIGNLGRDPEVREIPGGSAVCTVSVATTRRYKGGDGQRQEEAEWHRVVCFGRTAELIGNSCRKGDPIYIEGRLRTRRYTGKDGIERFQTEIVCENFQFLSSRHGDGSAATDTATASLPAASISTASASPHEMQVTPRRFPPREYDDLDEDVPF